MAEWLCSGLQIRLGRFDSGLRLQTQHLAPLQYHPPAHSFWSFSAPPSAGDLEQYWLLRPGALTAGLRKLGDVKLRVVTEHKEHLTPAEAWMLQRPAGAAIWVREIIMAINGHDSVFARSFTPLDASTNQWKGIRQLQTRPLADMLYHDPDIARSRFVTCQLTHEEPIARSLQAALGVQANDNPAIFARASAFYRDAQPLLVAECFLPAFWGMAKREI